MPVAQADEAKPASPAATPGATPSLIDAAWDFDPASPRYALDLYNPNYLPFARYSNNVNNQPFTPIFDAEQLPPQGLDSTAAKYQISFKARLWTTDDRRWGVWGAAPSKATGRSTTPISRGRPATPTTCPRSSSANGPASTSAICTGGCSTPGSITSRTEEATFFRADGTGVGGCDPAHKSGCETAL